MARPPTSAPLSASTPAAPPTQRRSPWQRAARLVLWGLAVLLAIPVLAVALVFAGLNTSLGQDQVARLLPQVTGGMVAVDGLSGRFPDALRVSRITVSDRDGVWLTLRDVALDWTPSRLLDRLARVDRLAANSVVVARLPVSEPSSAQNSRGGSFKLPVRVALQKLEAAHVQVAAPVAGAAATLRVQGSGAFAALDDARADLIVTRLDKDGRYRVAGKIDPLGLSATVDAAEPPGGLASEIGGIPALGAVTLTAKVDGPWNATATSLSLAAGPLSATVEGTVDVRGQSANLSAALQAPAMAPRPDVRWQRVALDAHISGPFSRPLADAKLVLTGLEAAGAAVPTLDATVHGDSKGSVILTAQAAGVRIPGPKPDLFAVDPVRFEAQATLDDPARPVQFTLRHALLSLEGRARTAGGLAAEARMDVPDLAPLAAAGGVDVAGRTTLDFKAEQGEAGTALDVDGTLALTSGPAQAVVMLGDETRIGLTARVQGNDLAIPRLTIDGKAVQVAANGTLADGLADFSWHVGLPDLAAVAGSVQGALTLTGRAHGRTDALTLDADATGEIAAPGVKRGPLTVRLSATGLPGVPAGRVTAEGKLDGAPLALDVTADRSADGMLNARIVRADWKSAHAEGALTLAQGADLPRGRVEFRMDRLADLRGLMGQPLTGAVSGTLEMTDERDTVLTALRIDARGTGLPGTATVGRATLEARLRDPLGARVVEATLVTAGLDAGGIGGDARVTAQGPQSALVVAAKAALTGVGGAPLAAQVTARLDIPGSSAAISAIQATWRDETLRLLAPARVGFGDQVQVDRLRLGLGDAVLELAGRFSPTLDANASLRNVRADLLRIVAPDLPADGMLEADARLRGTAAKPTGTVRVAATGLRVRRGGMAGLPPGSLTADARLEGATARVSARAVLGPNRIGLDGTAPLDGAGPLDLRATGTLDLFTFDPLLAAGGRRARGRVALDMRVAGTAAAPRATGALTVTGGEVQDFAQGARLTDIAARVDALGDNVRVTRLDAKAGPGTISVTGSLGLAGDRPIDLQLTARNARPLASDRLTANLDADISLRGALTGRLDLTGGARVRRADIRIPDKLPAQVAVLRVTRPGQTPPNASPAAPGGGTAGPADLGLRVTLDAPGQVFVRGRGLEAELEGKLTVTGTAAKPEISGGFKLRRGQFNLAGRTLTFTTGEVSFDGSGGLDPTLNFVAQSTNGSTTAQLAITGYASAPKIALSSTPPLPQDEVLAQLLFNQSASSLGPLQLAEAAAALAQVSGAGGFDPLNSVRQGLGLDRLSVGSDTAGGANVQAGRYVARGVYLGAKQSTAGSGTQATVQVDLLRGLKLEADVGTGGQTSATGSAATTQSSGTSIGLSYSFDY